ncbi:MAG TPA: N-acetylglucosamine-6-phosphate deacetylase, partial [Planctomycetaceae bacterium]|nr:N-acetylglucosamine-6-phosphate deacetylase [Planctomycetaceae bacterium]
IIRAKGVRGVILTCDASGLAGCSPGVYTEGKMRMEVLPDGRIVVAGQRELLAGSAADTCRCVVEAMRLGVSRADALDMAGRNPARLLGFEEIRLRPGSRADLFIFRGSESNSLEVRAAIAAGSLRFGTVSSP